MAEYRAQEQELIYALDIGTRSVVGIVGKPVGERFKVMDVESAEHSSRAMLDGQIDNIQQVADLARTVTERLEERLNTRLQRVCVAAAGRALRTQSGSFSMELAEKEPIQADLISRLEAGALSVAEESLRMEEETRRQFFMVGYTVAQYRLDNYPLSTLLDHSGRRAEADVVATFLPGEVVESLYAAMRAAGLQVSSLTLEPIAAMNAAIPAELRLLNLALVDIGAGTTDIAICQDGSVVGYTMATIAGDEVTEAIMKAFLVDFSTAEMIKRSLGESKEIRYTDILGLENTVKEKDLRAVIQEPMDRLASAIAGQVLEVNQGSAPSALFLAGGGSKLSGLQEKVAGSLKMDPRRVAIAGSNFAKTAFADTIDLANPEYATPLGIAVSAGLGLLNDSYVVTLNGESAKLFRSGILTLRDILQMNGYTYADMLGRSGRNLSVTVDGQRVVLRGEPAVPAIIKVNDEDAPISRVIHAGDRVTFTPARPGADAAQTVGQIVGEGFSGKVLVNNQEVPLHTPLRSGDVVLTLEKHVLPRTTPQPPKSTPAVPKPAVPDVPPRRTPVSASLELLLNGKPLLLPAKEDGRPYYLMDLLEHSGLDLEHLDRPVQMSVNGQECSFSQVLHKGDVVVIRS